MDLRLDTIPVSEWGFFDESIPPLVIAGPCSAESELQVMLTAKELNSFGIHVFRAGIWKPRTHPGSFEGVGTQGLKWLQKVKKEFGMKVGTEVASEKHVYECIKYGVDIVWIGARTTANPFLVQEIADALRDTDIPVLVKNPVNPDIDLWIGALERLNQAGVRKLGVIHRGFSTVKKIPYRNDPGWKLAVELRTRCPEIPFFADPSHMGGSRAYLQELSQRAMDLGLDGLMVESHCDPSCALSDAKQQLTPDALRKMLESLTVRQKVTNDAEYNENIEQLRAQIDVIDENLIRALASRLEISRRIGEFKKAHNIAIVQASRWESILSTMIEKGRENGLPEEFVSVIFNAIHESSVAEQNRILEG